MPNRPCRSPEICRVKFHRETTKPRCYMSPAEKKQSTRRLEGGISALSTEHPNERQIAQLEATLQKRVNAPEFLTLLERKEELAGILPDLYDRVKAETDPLEKTRLKREYKELHVQKLENRAKIEAYKDVTAQTVVYPLTQLTEGRVPEFTGDRLGNCVRTVSAETGSREWLEQRQKGIGGSDVGAIIGTGGEYADRNYEEVFLSKVEPISEDQVEVQSVQNAGGALGRGHTWEELTRERFQDENPDFEVMRTKDSWVHKDDPNKVINVDGLLSDTGDGVPNGIWEGKTSSRPEDWEDGVPEGYKAQVLRYLDVTGFKYGYVSVMINDNDYRQYRIEANDPVTTNSGTKPYSEYQSELDKFWDKVEEYKKNPPKPAPVPPSKSNKSQFKSVTDVAVRNLSAHRDEDPEITRELIQREIRSGKTTHNAIMGLYKSFDPAARRRNLAYVDLETTSLSDMTADIIEVGVTVRNHRNEVVKEFSKLYSPDPRVIDITGTGAEEVHQIKPDDVRGQPMFTDPQSQAEVWEVLQDTIIVAHNAGFEDRMFTANLEGYQEAEIPKIDTMHVARYGVPDGHGNSLESFAEHHGVEYVNSHRALPDAAMTADAHHEWLQRLRS